MALPRSPGIVLLLERGGSGQKNHPARETRSKDTFLRNGTRASLPCLFGPPSANCGPVVSAMPSPFFRSGVLHPCPRASCIAPGRPTSRGLASRCLACLLCAVLALSVSSAIIEVWMRRPSGGQSSKRTLAMRKPRGEYGMSHCYVPWGLTGKAPKKKQHA